MEESSDQGQGKKKITEVKTFSVPFALEEKKENSIPHAPSKEKIINQAFKFHSQGNISEAEKYYRIFLDQGFSDPRVNSNLGQIFRAKGNLKKAELLTRQAIKLVPNFADAHYNLGGILIDLCKLKEAELSTRQAIQINPDFANSHYNLGIILKDLGKLKDAELSYRKAIALNPNLPIAHLNLANIFRDLGKLKDAELSIRKAIELNPNLPIAHLNLANIFRDLGKLKDAELSIRKAIELNPNLPIAHLNLGNIFRDLGKTEEAFDSYLKAIDTNPTLSNIYPSITRFLKYSDLSKLNKSKLKNILNILLEKNDVHHKELVNAWNFLYRNEIVNILEKYDSDFSEIELIINDTSKINALKKIIFCDLKLEELLTKTRRNICNRIAKNIDFINCSELQFIIALGEQCFLNEYVYSFTSEEKISLNTIIYQCMNGEINETKISILSCYSPLYKLLDKIPALQAFNSSNQSFKELIELQINEPLKEIELSRNIKKLGSINDDCSQKVKSQYEVNPYPRWRYANHSENQKISIMQGINNEINPNHISQNLGNEQLKVLIAGCGTGNQILQAQRYRNAKIVGIDLSLSSLAYAQRKINELGIDNVELIHMDILEVNLLEKKFDIILCSGVLHHMDDPSIGLRALVGVLNNNGFIKLGLYSELARQDIVKAKNYIASKQLQPNEDDIRNFRQKVFSSELSNLNSLKNRGDFYSLSECRDLCFHAQEHRFTIKRLQETLQSNELKFLGFLLPKQIKSVYEQSFPEDKKQTNLQNWVKFEEKHPNTFKEMYQFWVSEI
ncbi:tetratricopeptide repeat protein [Prochlorococcus sp. MIT 0916]|uniref:tetratricopeptide repeat protein n=1 Tax=Prochlorococcus sp. MIT 0916 TaxID=3082521 RepID=UPI0039B505CA